MTPVTIDFETYWTADYSLSKLSFIEYIKDPQFEVISLAIKVGNAETEVLLGEDAIRARLQQVDWSDAMCIAHNGNEFDFPLLVWAFDCHPKLFADTLALSKPKHQSEVGGSLKKLSERYGLPEKDNAILLSTKGKRLVDFELRETLTMLKYNKGDTDNAYSLFKRFIKDTPPKELLLADMTARMICYPQLEADTALLDATLKKAEEQKQQLLQQLVTTLPGCLDEEDVRVQMASAPKFAAALHLFGVDPPTKISKKTQKVAFAFAKTDEAFLALQEHPDERVQVLTAARLGVKSTLLETRLAKMSTCAKLMGGRMPVPLGYHSATTGRWGGRVWNPQNLTRIPRDKQGRKIPKLTNAMRESLIAPPGYKIVVVDAAGIELRVNHYLWQVASTAELFAADPQADLYKTFAAALFGIPISAVTKEQRQLAKVAQLGLGFGAGAATFRRVAKTMGGIDLDSMTALQVVEKWREEYLKIVIGWRQCQRLVQALFLNADFSPDPRGLVKSDKGSVLLPSGRRLYYPNLESMPDPDTGRAQFVYGTGRSKSKVYAGLMDENLVQAIARDILAEQALEIYHRTGMYPALMVHDELVYAVPSDKAPKHLDLTQSVMRTAPAWLPGIVLWSEGDIADTYGDAK